MSTPSNPLWGEHVDRLQQLHHAPAPARRARPTPTACEAEAARSGEWTAAPPGRLGRRLLADVDAYLGFFAIARGG